MFFGRGFHQGFKRGAFNGYQKGRFPGGGSFKNFARMQTHMSFSQITMLRGQMFMSQAQQGQLAACNMLMMNIQMNWLLLNEEAESGINPNSEDLGKYTHFILQANFINITR